MGIRKLSSKVILIASIAATGGFALSFAVPKTETNQNLASKETETETVKDQKPQIEIASAQPISIPQNLNSDVPKVFQGTTIYQAKLKNTEKVIALTFDDGPGPKNTAQVLDILKKNEIKATFFMIGQMVQTFPKIAKQVAEDGHVIGNHTWHHWYRRMDTATAASEIDRTADIIFKTTGIKPTLFRPPGGFLHNGLVDYAKKEKQAIMMWSVASGDAERTPASVPMMVKNVLKGAKPGGIVLLHDGGGNRGKTVKALPQIISGLKAQGYRFVTVPELLEIEAKEEHVAAAELPANKQDEYSNSDSNTQ